MYICARFHSDSELADACLHANIFKYPSDKKNSAMFNNFLIDMPDVLTEARAGETRGTAPR